METEPLRADRDDRGCGASDAGRFHGGEGDAHLCRLLVAHDFIVRCRKILLSPRRSAIGLFPMLNGARGHAEARRCRPHTADGSDHNTGGRQYHADVYATFAQGVQEIYTTFALAHRGTAVHHNGMLSSDEILAKLKANGVTHERIAAVLGVTTPNATKLYNPAGKTGKPRRLAYDEAVKLIEKFELTEAVKPIGPLSEPVARLLVQYVASRLGVKVSPEDPQVGELAQDIQAFSEFAAEPHVRESSDKAIGFFQALKSRPLVRRTAQ